MNAMNLSAAILFTGGLLGGIWWIWRDQPDYRWWSIPALVAASFALLAAIAGVVKLLACALTWAGVVA